MAPRSPELRSQILVRADALSLIRNFRGLAPGIRSLTKPETILSRAAGRNDDDILRPGNWVPTDAMLMEIQSSGETQRATLSRPFDRKIAKPQEAPAGKPSWLATLQDRVDNVRCEPREPDELGQMILTVSGDKRVR